MYQVDEKRWSQLEMLLSRPHRGRRRLAPSEVEEVARLYRQAATDLAVVRRTNPQSLAAGYLNDLVLRAHSRLYIPPRGNLRGVLEFLSTGFPRLVTTYGRPFFLAAALFVLGGLIGMVAVAWDPNLAEAFVPASLRQFVADPLTGELAPLADSPHLSTAIMTNNIKVGILALGLGLTFGLGTAYVLISNGLIIGAMAVTFHRQGLGTAFWATILPHGVIELTAIFISGAAGFILAGALVRPGSLPRRQALARSGPAAIGLALGTIPMYVVAGLIEGFVTPRGISHEAKLGVAALTGLVLLVYLVWLPLRNRRQSLSAKASPAS